MAELPEDLMVEIAPRLPVKSVGRFRSLSKRWNLYLSSPEFVKSYQQYDSILVMDSTATNPIAHVINPATGSSRPVNSQLPEDSGIMELVGCCNGLALLSVLNHGLVVINLVTSRASPVIKPLNFGNNIGPGKAGIPGLGYSIVDDDYKVVVLYPYTSGVSIFSLKTRTWKKLGGSPYLHHPRHKPVYADDHLYWLTLKEDYGTFVIAAFDLSIEKFVDQVPSPITTTVAMDLNLDVMGGCLAMVECYCSKLEEINVWMVECYCSKLEEINVWIMEKPGSWTHFTIHNNNNEPRRHINCVICRLGEFEFVLAVDYHKELVAYNCQTKAWRNLDIHGLSKVSSSPGRILSFRESLSLLSSI